MKIRNGAATEKQYTIRAIPVRIDTALRSRAHREQKSLNALVVEILSASVNADSPSTKRRDMSKYSGVWKDDPEFDRALEQFERIDEDMWQ
jgi:hypothetical protein